MSHRWFSFTRTGCILFALMLFAQPLPAAAFTNGQAASLVLGQPDFTSSPQATTASGVHTPHGVAADSDGHIWVADTFNHRVLRFDSAASKANGAPADGVLGQSDFTSGTPATTANGMNTPSGVVVDSAGRLWVADTGNNRVLCFDDAASKADGASADGVLGQPSFASNDFATTASGMNAPGGVAVDSAGRLWVADTGNSRVLRFDDAASKADGASADGLLGQLSFASSDFATTASGMWTPKGVTVGSAGRVWVADTGNNRVLRFDDAASKVDGASADGVLGQIDFTSRATATTASGMNGPYGVAVDSTDRLWIVDHFNNRVLRFNGTSADVVLGQSDFTSSVAAISATGMLFPRGVAVGSVGSIWVADGSRVLRFAHMITPTITWANPAAITYGTPLSAAQLNASADVPGSFSYSPPQGTVLNVGMGQPLSLTFNPTNSANYTPVSKTVTIDVVLRLYLPPIRR